jgi:hypothetical protein
MWRSWTLVVTIGCSGESEDLLKNGPTVGTTCTHSSYANLVAVPVGDASKYKDAHADLHGDGLGIWLHPLGALNLSTCGLYWSGSGPEEPWKMTIDAQRLGTFSVEGGDVTMWSATDKATMGFISINGYDALANTLCGFVDAVTESGGDLRGSFNAAVYCE